MRPIRGPRAAALLLAVCLAVASCGSGSGGTAQPGKSSLSTEPVTLQFWSWVPDIDKIVQDWNSKHPRIQVRVSKPAQGDGLVTKILAANKAGNPPDLMQAEYQALPALVTNGVAADITSLVADASGAFPDGAWSQVTFDGKRFAVPQDMGPLMLFYREDLFKQYGVKVPTTWDEYGVQARALHAKHPKVFLGGFSSSDPGWFSGIAAQAGGRWWTYSGDSWTVGINDAGSKKAADFWYGLVTDGAVDVGKWFTPEWNTKLNNGTQLSWISAVWAPGVLDGNAATTKGKWAMAPIPQWGAGEQVTGNWGGSSTAVAAKSKHLAEATQFAIWLNTSGEGVDALITKGFVYPASSAGQSSPVLSKAPAVLAPDQSDFFARAKEIAATSKSFTWGPDVNLAYSVFNDSFSAAVDGKSSFSGALDAMQKATVADMKRSGFSVR